MDEWSAYDIADPRWLHPLDVTQHVYGSPDGGFRRTKLQVVRHVTIPWAAYTYMIHMYISHLCSNATNLLKQVHENAALGIWQASEYYRDPVKSYVDQALFYQSRMMTWANGI